MYKLFPRTDAHRGEKDGPKHHQDIAPVDVAGAVVDAVRVGLVVVGDFLILYLGLRVVVGCCCERALWEVWG